MKWRLPLSTIIAAVLVASALRVAPLIVTVEGAQMVFEPAFIRVRIRVEPDDQNRALTFGIVSAEYERSSLEQLDGDKAPTTRWITYKDIPAGEYEVIAEVYRPLAETWHAESRFTVLGRH